MPSSVYTQCSKAARDLIDEGAPFTERDVLDRAESEDWDDFDRQEAARSTGQVLATLFRTNRLVRFGVVPKAVSMISEDDYVRQSGQIVYASFAVWDGKSLQTPNGTFEAITYGRDPLFKWGRRRATSRNDFIPWDQQGEDSEGDRTRESFKQQLAARDRLLAEKEDEIERLREALDRLQSGA